MEIPRVTIDPHLLKRVIENLQKIKTLLKEAFPESQAKANVIAHIINTEVLLDRIIEVE